MATRCLCGRAALTQKLVFKDCVDADHENLPAGITPHGHYNIPIVADGNTLGVLNLYVKECHQPDSTEQQFLTMVASALASIIKRKQSESRLHILSHAVESSGLMVLITDHYGKIEYVNPQFTKVTGYTTDELIGKSPRLLQAIETSKEVYKEMRKVILSGKEWRGEFYNKTRSSAEQHSVCLPSAYSADCDAAENPASGLGNSVARSGKKRLHLPHSRTTEVSRVSRSSQSW